MTEKTILNIISNLEPHLFFLLFKLLLAGFAVLFLKAILENLVAYVQFSSNKRLGIGVKVRVRGKPGKISWFNLRWIFVHTQDGEEIIAMKRWMYEQWAVLNNNNDKK